VHAACWLLLLLLILCRPSLGRCRTAGSRGRDLDDTITAMEVELNTCQSAKTLSRLHLRPSSPAQKLAAVAALDPFHTPLRSPGSCLRLQAAPSVACML
jgi:hypothetical protein